MVNITIIGAAGRMGTALIRCAKRIHEVRLVGAVERAECPALGKDAGLVAGVDETGVLIGADLYAAMETADVVIDFSLHTALAAHVRAAAERNKAMVIGTTGLFDAEKAVLHDMAKRIPVVWAPNMSVGVNLLFSLVNKAAAILGTAYDVEIVEMHHRHKKDAPSGTALRLGELVAKGRNQDFSSVVVNGREGITGERPAGQIGIHAMRGGDIVGDHTVIFAGEGERVELGHRVTNREALAQGALRAALWIKNRKPGLYDMQDVLGL